MGGRGASSGISAGGKIYGTEYKSVFQVDNIKFVKRLEGSATAPMETMTKGRVYVTVNKENEIKCITYYNKYKMRYKQIDVGHFHKIDGILTKPHTHFGYEHSEYGTKKLSKKEQKLLDKVVKAWYNHLNGGD